MINAASDTESEEKLLFRHREWGDEVSKSLVSHDH